MANYYLPNKDFQTPTPAQAGPEQTMESPANTRPSCKSCQSQDYAMEHGERICINCGDVQDELATDESPGGGGGGGGGVGGVGDLCLLPDGEAFVENLRNKNREANERLTGRIRNETNSNETKRQIGREKLVVEMRKIVEKLIKHPMAVDETIDLMSSVFKAHKGRLLSSKKYGLVGACIYYLSGKYQIGISLADISKVLDIKMKVLNCCLKEVRELCPNFEYKRPNIEDLVKKFVDDLASKHYDLASLEATSNQQDNSYPSISDISRLSNQPLIDNKDKNMLQARIMYLIEIFEKTYPKIQPTPHILITAALYHAWKSFDTIKSLAANITGTSSLINDTDRQQLRSQAMKLKFSMSYEKFCQLCKFKYSSNGQKIATKLHSSLLGLGRKGYGDVNKTNLHWYLEDILQNSRHLLKEYLRTMLAAESSNEF